MKAENTQRSFEESAMAYREQDFSEKAAELNNIVYTPEDQL